MEKLNSLIRNKQTKTFLLVFGSFLFLPIIYAVSKTSIPTEKYTSIYTSISKGNCRAVSTDDEIESTVLECNGIANYTLKILIEDARQSITVISPQKKEFPLDYWQVITPYFSFLGDKAEWRILKTNNKITPISLIVRVNATEQKTVDGEIKQVSYLAVAKITPKKICVTNKIPPIKNANKIARLAADKSTNKPCLQ